MSKYDVIDGKFFCHTCKEEVKSLRFYLETGDITWMCSKKHLSKVELRNRGY